MYFLKCKLFLGQILVMIEISSLGIEVARQKISIAYLTQKRSKLTILDHRVCACGDFSIAWTNLPLDI